MNRYQKIASKLAKDIKVNEEFNSYNINKNMYLNIFKKNSWPIKKVQEFKNNKKERAIINENIKIITDFINSILMDNTKDTFINFIDFEIIDNCNIRMHELFFTELDAFFSSLGATYSYTRKEDALNFSVTFFNNIVV